MNYRRRYRRWAARDERIQDLIDDGATVVWFDPHDWTTLFEDDAGTTAVTAYGQAVGHMADKSGNDAHATQATAGLKPTAQIDHIVFDLSDDVLSATMPDLGTDATIVYLDETGIQFETGQTITGATNLPQKAKLGPIVYINRAISEQEKAVLTHFMTARLPL